MNKSNVDALPFQQKIAMLTDIIENDESKCAIYFPQNVGKFLCFLSNEERRQKDYQHSQAQIDEYMAEHEREWFDLAQPNEIHTEIIVNNRCFSSLSSFDVDGDTDATTTTTTIACPSAFNFNFFAVKTVDCLNKGGYTIRKFHCLYHTCKLLNKHSNSDADRGLENVSPDKRTTTANDESIERKVHTFVVYHYWFPHWPDHRSPENIDVVLDMCLNLIDSDCEQQLSNAHSYDLLRANDAIVESDAAAANNLVDVSARQTIVSTSATKLIGRQSTDSTHSQPFMLNHVQFNGPIPIIHWFVFQLLI